MGESPPLLRLRRWMPMLLWRRGARVGIAINAAVKKGQLLRPATPQAPHMMKKPRGVLFDNRRLRRKPCHLGPRHGQAGRRTAAADASRHPAVEEGGVKVATRHRRRRRLTVMTKVPSIPCGPPPRRPPSGPTDTMSSMTMMMRRHRRWMRQLCCKTHQEQPFQKWSRHCVK